MIKLILTAAALTFTAGTALAQDVVRLGTEGAYPPFNFINDNNEVDGFEREFGDEVCKRAALTCEWVTNEWDTIIPNLVSGNYDVIIAALSITDERKQVIEFSENYTPPALSTFLALSADTDPRSGPIAAQTATIQATYVAEQGYEVVEYPSADETIAAVRNGEAVAVFAEKDYLAPFQSESNGELAFVGEEIPLGNGVGLGLRKSDTALKAKLDDAIKSMKADGALNAMITKWFGDQAVVF